MPKIKTYQTRLPSEITGDEFALITDTTEERTYKINVTDYVQEISAPANINDISDVTITTPADGEVLKYSAGIWVNAVDASGVSSLLELTDTTITNPQDNEVLTYSSGAWINSAPVAVNPFDQDLNTSDTPEFSGMGYISKSDDAWYSFMVAGGGHDAILGWGNILIGQDTGRVINFGEENIIMGTQAGYALTDGTYNVIMGYLAASSMTDGGDNVCIGNSSGNFMTDGFFNVNVGRRAGRYNQSGNGNVCIGNSAGAGVSGNSNSYNVAVGDGSLSGVTTGSENVAIGRLAGNTIDDGSNIICIGKNANPSSPSATDQCIIGGTGADAVNTGFGGNNNPQYTIDATGEINCTTGYRVNGTAGATGSFTAQSGETVTVTNGIITNIA